MRNPRRNKHRLFLDANVLFSAAWREEAGVARLWALDEVVLLASAYALEEARRNLGTERHARLEKLSVQLEIVGTLDPTALPAGISLPSKDTPILGAALAGRATHLITGDLKHFGSHFGKRLAGILVLPPGRYLARSRQP